MNTIITRISVSGLIKRLKRGDATIYVAQPSKTTMFVKQKEKKKTKANIPLVMLKVFTEDYIHSNSKCLTESTLRNYRCAVNSFLRFQGGKDILISQLTVARVEEYELWLDAHSVSPNTASAYMRSLRALYNKAPLGKMQKKSNLFATVKTSNTKTDKRAAEASDIKRLVALDLNVGTLLCLSRDVFLFCVFAMGMPFVDAAHLKKSQIHGDIIEYRRQKTGKVIRVKIEPCMQILIDRYNEPGNEYVFPILKSMNRGKDKQTMDRHYGSALSYYNHELKVLGKMAGIKIKLTSYVARHTWASLAYINKVDIAVISQALGHSSTSTTQIYIKEINGNVVFKANAFVLNILGSANQVKKCTSLQEVQQVYRSLC
jgi:integrase/recombinase XerD